MDFYQGRAVFNVSCRRCAKARNFDDQSVAAAWAEMKAGCPEPFKCRYEYAAGEGYGPMVKPAPYATTNTPAAGPPREGRE